MTALSRRVSGGAGMQVRVRLVLLAALPALLLLGGVFAYPIVQTIQLSLSDWRGFGPMDWVGLENYQDVLSSKAFWDALRNTVVFALAATICIVASALLLAVAATRGQKYDSTFRAMWFLPAIVPGTAAAVFWSISVQPQSE